MSLHAMVVYNRLLSPSSYTSNCPCQVNNGELYTMYTDINYSSNQFRKTISKHFDLANIHRSYHIHCMRLTHCNLWDMAEFTRLLILKLISRIYILLFSEISLRWIQENTFYDKSTFWPSKHTSAISYPLHAVESLPLVRYGWIY